MILNEQILQVADVTVGRLDVMTDDRVAAAQVAVIRRRRRVSVVGLVSLLSCAARSGCPDTRPCPTGPHRPMVQIP